MGADFSRVRFNPLLDYAGVELQQGRVLLDADANELVGIVDRRLRALASDVLGRATVSSTTPDAFKVSLAGGTLQIARGRLYVDGLLAENHGATSIDPAKHVFDDLLAEPRFADPVAYTAQPYLPNPPALPGAGRHLVYLDVWDREVTYLERPDLIESAVGVDATSRVQTVWQMRVLAEEAGAGTNCASPDADVPGWSALTAPSTGVLTTGTFDIAAVDDPCELPPTGGYRGLENQLYRVEIHDPGQAGAGATFKWSRENASVGSRVASIVSGTELELQSLGRDDVLRFNTDDWVEIIDDVRELDQRPGEIRRVTVVEATRRLQFAPALPVAMLPAAFPDSALPAARNLRVRRWDQKGRVFRTDPSGTPVPVQNLDDANSPGVITVPDPATTLLLDNGVTVRFASGGAPGFRRGDYWVFAARTSDASVELLDRAPPRGIHHHFARLGLWDVAANSVADCRNPWPPPGEGHDCSCTACVTAASHASGSFTIQDAVDQVRGGGGTVCLGPGQFALAAPVTVVGARALRIRGQGASTTLACAGTAFAVQDGLAVAIENLAIVSIGSQPAVSVRTAIGLTLRQLVISVLGRGDVQGAAIALEGIVASASIRENAIFAPVGVLANDPAAPPPVGRDPGETFLLVAALGIEDNAFWCGRRAVALDGPVLQLLGTRIVGNDILGCDDVAVSAVGVGSVGSSMTIRANALHVAGDGIRCGVNGVWIDSNKLVNSAGEAAQGAKDTTGIALTAGPGKTRLGKTGPDQCQILSNQVSGFLAAGIRIEAPTPDLLVKLNIIESCGNGIVVTAGSDVGSLSIENNLLRDIGPKLESATGMVLGIAVLRAQAATIVGNTIRVLGVQAPRSTLRAAILTFGVLRPRVSGNEATDIGVRGNFGDSAGIMLRAPYMDFDVSHNRVQRDNVPSDETRGSWWALIAADFDDKSPVLKLGDLVSVSLANSQVLTMHGAQAHVSAAAGGVRPARGSVHGNILQARGATPAVDVASRGECLFSDNRVESVTGGKAAVVITTPIAIVNANRVSGGELSILLNNTKSAAVLGNITTGGIDIPGGLQPPWDLLNLRA